MTGPRTAAAVAVAALAIAAADVALLVDGTREAASTTAAPEPTAGESLDEQLARVAAIVEDVRGLTFDDIPEPTYLPPADLAERAGRFVAEYPPEEAEVDARLLVALGAIPDGTDLRELLATALSEQIAGFYDPRSDELVVGTSSRGDRLGPLDEITLAHELEHALADQRFGLPLADGDVPEGEEDAAFAAQALVEGDATVTMSLYAEEALSIVDQARLLAEQQRLAAELGDLTALPHFLQRALTFPYQEGVAFVTSVRDAAGWSGVDEAYRQLPTTTLQILRPDLFLAGRGGAEDPRDVAVPGAPWDEAGRFAVGAADLLFLFEAPGGDPGRALDDPRRAAERWRGGEAVVLVDGDRTAVGLALRGAEGLCAAVGGWYGAAFGRGRPAPAGTEFEGDVQDAVLACDGADVRLGIAPDLPTARALTR